MKTSITLLLVLSTVVNFTHQTRSYKMPLSIYVIKNTELFDFFQDAKSKFGNDVAIGACYLIYKEIFNADDCYTIIPNSIPLKNGLKIPGVITRDNGYKNRQELVGMLVRYYNTKNIIPINVQEIVKELTLKFPRILGLI